MITYGDESIQKIEALHNLGRTVFALGDFKESFNIAKQIVELHEKLDGPEHIKTGRALSNLGVSAFKYNKQRECELAMLRSLYIFEEEYGVESKEVLLHRGRMMTFKVPDGEFTEGLSHDEYVAELKREERKRRQTSA